MPKGAEINYVANMARVLRVTPADVERHLMTKPYADAACWSYLLDMAQVLKLLPPNPARLLDLGTGSGWTAELFARCGYTVVGIDIAPDMIELARRRLDERLELRFEVCDYEAPVDLGVFDAVVIYDALHHAENEAGVIENAFRALRDGGVFITVEPGVGHGSTPGTQDVVAKFGTTEKDMPCTHQARLMRATGFTAVRQYLRLSQLPVENVANEAGSWRQSAHFQALMQHTAAGHTSIVVAVKGAAEEAVPPTASAEPTREAPAGRPPAPESRPPALREVARASAAVLFRATLASARIFRDGGREWIAARRRRP